jgi:hypothetical protein
VNGGSWSVSDATSLVHDSREKMRAGVRDWSPFATLIHAELLHARNAAVQHLDDFVFGHRRQMNVALNIELSIGDIVELAVFPTGG